ncbi:MAG: ParA family protein, partial [Mycobacterium sp.]
GGVGKTTTAMFLAAAAVRRGIPVRVVDADPQGSASSWADRAACLGTPFETTALLAVGRGRGVWRRSRRVGRAPGPRELVNHH